MIGLAVASLVTWTVWVAKSVELFGARGSAAQPTLFAEFDQLAQALDVLQALRGRRRGRIGPLFRPVPTRTR
jgi:biopolymer transport protein ExbB